MKATRPQDRVGGKSSVIPIALLLPKRKARWRNQPPPAAAVKGRVDALSYAVEHAAASRERMKGRQKRLCRHTGGPIKNRVIPDGLAVIIL